MITLALWYLFFGGVWVALTYPFQPDGTTWDELLTALILWPFMLLILIIMFARYGI